MAPAVASPLSSDWKGGALPDVKLERVVGVPDFQEPWFLRKGSEIAPAICLVLGQGTAFLIRPNVILTNWHIFRREDWAEGKFVYFDYEQDENELAKTPIKYALSPGKFFFSNEEHDFAAVYVEGDPSLGRSVIDISAPGAYQEDGRANIIQHPGANLKKIAIRNNGLKYLDDKVLQYWTDTEHGSSGSPVFDDKWKIIGLHYREDSAPGPAGETIYYNEAHRIEPIWEMLKAILP